MHFKYLSSVAINLLKIVSFYRQECKGVVWFLDLCSRHDIAEIFLMLALNTNQSINQSINQSWFLETSSMNYVNWVSHNLDLRNSRWRGQRVIYISACVTMLLTITILCALIYYSKCRSEIWSVIFRIVFGAFFIYMYMYMYI